MSRQRLLVMNEPYAMRINADLAKEIGLNESIVLLQLEYLIGISDNERDGKRWTYQSLTDLQGFFKWWSIATISRAISKLEKLGLIYISNEYNKMGYDRTQWYALNFDGIQKLHSVAISQNAKWETLHTNAILQNEKSILQFDGMDDSKLQNGSRQFETTIPETTSETTQRGGDAETTAKNTTRPMHSETNDVPTDEGDLKEIATAAATVCGSQYRTNQKHGPAFRALVTMFIEQAITPETIIGFQQYWKSNENWIARKAMKDHRVLDKPYPHQVEEHWQAYQEWSTKRTKKQSSFSPTATQEQSLERSARLTAEKFAQIERPDFGGY